MTEVAQGEQPPVLDAQQEFTDASSYQVRDELAGLIERDLLGPWDGEAEVLPPRSAGPGERYLVGRIGPRRDPRSRTDAAGDAVDTEIAAGGDGADGELPELLTMQNAGRMWASSMGLSCVAASGIDTLTVTAAWGRYGKADVLDEAGNPRRCWSREPVRYVRHVRFGDGLPAHRADHAGSQAAGGVPGRRYPAAGQRRGLWRSRGPARPGQRPGGTTLMSARASGTRTGWRPPGCRLTRCPRRSRHPPSPDRICKVSSFPWTRWPQRPLRNSRPGSGRWRTGMRPGLTSRKNGWPTCPDRCERPHGRRSSPRAGARTASGPGSSWCPRLPLPVTRRRCRRSGSPMRRWRCSGGIPPSPPSGRLTG